MKNPSDMSIEDLKSQLLTVDYNGIKYKSKCLHEIKNRFLLSIMKNLTKYEPCRVIEDWKDYPDCRKSSNGEYVKIEDIKKFLIEDREIS